MPECHAPPPSSPRSLARRAGRVNGLARPAPPACQMLYEFLKYYLGFCEWILSSCNDLPLPWSSQVDARRSTLLEFKSRSTLGNRLWDDLPLGLSCTCVCSDPD
eukprot:5899102-Pleurochrysis_carterae.AAC.1